MPDNVLVVPLPQMPAFEVVLLAAPGSAVTTIDTSLFVAAQLPDAAIVYLTTAVPEPLDGAV